MKVSQNQLWLYSEPPPGRHPIDPSLNAGSTKQTELLLKAIVDNIADKAGYKPVNGVKGGYKERGRWGNTNRLLAGGRNANITQNIYYSGGNFIGIRALEAFADLARNKEGQENLNNILKSTFATMPCANRRRQNLFGSVLENKEIIDKVTNSEGVRDRFFSSDLLRFRERLLATTDTEAFTNYKNKYSKTDSAKKATQDAINKTPTTLGSIKATYNGNKWARWWIKFARVFTGATECTSAPTGFVSKSFRNLFAGPREEGSLLHKALGPIFTICAGIAGTALVLALSKKMGPCLSIIGNNFANLLALFFAQMAFISGCCGLASFICTGIATLIARHNYKTKAISPSGKAYIAQETSVLVSRISEVMAWVKRGETAAGKGNINLDLLSKSLTKGIIRKFDPREINEDGVPYLIVALQKAQDLKGEFATGSCEEKRLRRQYQTAIVLGQYASGTLEFGSLNSDNSKHTKLRRELQVAALCMRVNNPKVNKGLESETASAKKRNDLRAIIEDDVMNKTLHQRGWAPLVTGLLSLFSKPNANYGRGNWAAKKIKQWERSISSAYATDRDKRYADPALHNINKYKSLYMDRNKHEYYPHVRFFLRLGELFNNISTHLVLAQNAQCSRGWGFLFKQFQLRVLRQPPSHALAAGFGRWLGGWSVAALWAAGVPGLGDIQNAAESHPYAFDISPNAILSLIAIGTLMAISMSLGAICQGTAMILARCGGHNPHYRLDPSKLLTVTL